ncbi:MAG: HD domain-containing protein [Victivallales bacterium]|nr:HD domain-containing protein [Victivallales bacterium]
MEINIQENDINGIKKWFFNYIDTFKSDDGDLIENIKLKCGHTLRVCNEISALGTELKLNQNQLYLVEIIALLHDIGRFEQYKNYRTFMDKVSVNHAEFGVKLLKECRVLQKLGEFERELIFEVIKNHNCALLPEEMPEISVFYCKILRDADKLDIYKVVTDHYTEMKKGKRSRAIELNLPNTDEVSGKVCNALMKKEIVKTQDIKTLNDFKLLQAAWIFDINFRYTLTRINKKRYLSIIKSNLPDNHDIDQLFSVIAGYINKKTGIKEIEL